MNYRLWLLIAALFCAAMLVAIDLQWIDVAGDTHLPAWLGMALFFYMAREVER